MTWTSEQLEMLYANVYGHRLQCPSCAGGLELTLSEEPDWLGAVTCAACNARHLVALHNDPLRNMFRGYTEQERRAMKAAERSRAVPTCPVDGTAMDVHLQRSFGLTSNVIARCRRCTREASFVRAHG